MTNTGKAIALISWFLTGCNAEATKQTRIISVPIESTIFLNTTQLGVGTIAANLDVPWDIAWGADNWIWFSEQKGTVNKVDPATGERKIVLRIRDVWHQRTAGLLGMAISPDIDKWPYVVLDYTFKKDSKVWSRLVRYTCSPDSLTSPLILLEVPGANSHNGSRVAFAADGKVFWATGDGLQSDLAQNVKSLQGKILRLNIDGSIPADNPIKGSAVWARGYRNIQGLVFASNNKLYTSEHGDANDDEVNLIHKGGNYGWPKVTGMLNSPGEIAFGKQQAIIEPLKAWTPTIAPAGIDYYNSSVIPEWENSLLLTTLKGSSLRVLKLNKEGTAVVSDQLYLDKAYGRLRDVCVSPAGDVYVSTSNRDWNPGEGFPKEKDDRIIRLFKMTAKDKLASDFEVQRRGEAVQRSSQKIEVGQGLYAQYCSSCHQPNGKGIPGTFPPLKDAEQVLGDKKQLTNIVLKGLSGTIKVKGLTYNQQMPAFDFLSDKELAEVLSYVRSSFGNKAGSISAADVSKAR